MIVDALVEAGNTIDQVLLQFHVNQLGKLGGSKMAEYLDHNDKIEFLCVHKHLIPVQKVRLGHAHDELTRYTGDAAEKAVIQQLQDEAVNPVKLLRNLRPFEEEDFIAMWEVNPEGLEEALVVAINKMLGSGDERDLTEDLKYLTEYVFPLPAFDGEAQFDQLQAIAQTHLDDIKVMMENYYHTFAKGDGGESMSILTNFCKLEPLRQDHPDVACIDPAFVKANTMIQSETEKEEFDYQVAMDKNCYTSMLANKAAVLDLDYIKEVHASLHTCKIRPIVNHKPYKTLAECRKQVLDYMDEDYNVPSSRPWPRACEIVDILGVTLICDGGKDITDTIRLLEKHEHFEVVALENGFHHDAGSANDGFRDVRLTLTVASRGQKILGELRIGDSGFLRLQKRMEKPQMILAAKDVNELIAEPQEDEEDDDEEEEAE